MNDKNLEMLKPYCENDMRLLKRISESIFKRFNEPLSKVDYDDFYSIANMTLWQACNVYNSDMGISFEGFLRSCLQKKFKSELTRRHRQKRVFDNFAISLDAPNSEDEEYTLLDYVKSDFDTFEEAMKQEDNQQYTEKVQKYISRLSSQQSKILNLLTEGYKPLEIRIILGISPKEYADNIHGIRAYENVKFLF